MNFGRILLYFRVSNRIIPLKILEFIGKHHLCLYHFYSLLFGRDMSDENV